MYGRTRPFFRLEVAGINFPSPWPFLDERGKLLFKEPQAIPQLTEEVLCYYSTIDGNGKWLLTKAGIDKCVVQMKEQGNVISEESITYQLDPTDSNYVPFTAKASLANVQQTTIGTKRQWKYKILRQDCEQGWRGDVVYDGYWFEKGSQKALLNAKRKLIPAEMKQDIFKQAIANNSRFQEQTDEPHNRENRIEYYLKFKQWQSKQIPFPITIAKKQKRIQKTLNWQQLIELEDKIITRSGKHVGVRQYLHMLENYQHQKDDRLCYKASAALILNKEHHNTRVDVCQYAYT